MSCKYCKEKTKEVLVHCGFCDGYCHPSCLELPERIVPQVKLYDWQCNDCKSCYECKDVANEDQILFCDHCDRGYHFYCTKPKVKRKPKGDWYCPICTAKFKETASKDVVKETEEENNEEDSAKPKNTDPCPIAKKYSPNKTCPFPGCDGVGNVRTNNNVHFSVSQCPMSRDEKKRERALLNMKSEVELKKLKIDDKKRDSQKENIPTVVNSKTFTQTPIEHIVSKTDIELFEAAETNSQILSAIEKEMTPNPNGLKAIVFGDVEMQAWYKSQYSLEYSCLSRLYICEFCLEYMKTETIFKRHMAKCMARHPPGNEIYRKTKLSVFEVDGQTATSYCQNLCLLAKLFLDHKTLWLDVAPFLFYVMTVTDDRGCHMVGYFSKEKVSFLNYNLSCILVMPNFMKQGYGRMLIDFSYLLSQVEGKTGSPERPLSDLGLISYRKFWGDKLLKYLMEFNDDHISIKGISEKLSLHANDIISTLQYLGMLKYWKGKHLILLKKELVDEYATKTKQRPGEGIDPKCLQWKPTTFT